MQTVKSRERQCADQRACDRKLSEGPGRSSMLFMWHIRAFSSIIGGAVNQEKKHAAGLQKAAAKRRILKGKRSDTLCVLKY